MEELHTLRSVQEFEDLIRDQDALLVYFSHEECNVCKVLKPKIRALLEMDFPQIKMVYADTMKLPELAGQQRIFTVPTVLVFFTGKEYFRVSRNIGVSALGQQIERPYAMVFGD